MSDGGDFLCQHQVTPRKPGCWSQASALCPSPGDLSAREKLSPLRALARGCPGGHPPGPTARSPCRSPRELFGTPAAAGGLALLPQPLRQLAGHPPAGHLPAGHQRAAHEPAHRHVQVPHPPPGDPAPGPLGASQLPPSRPAARVGRGMGAGIPSNTGCPCPVGPRVQAAAGQPRDLVPSAGVGWAERSQAPAPQAPPRPPKAWLFKAGGLAVCPGRQTGWWVAGTRGPHSGCAPQKGAM